MQSNVVCLLTKDTPRLFRADPANGDKRRTNPTTPIDTSPRHNNNTAPSLSHIPFLPREPLHREPRPYTHQANTPPDDRRPGSSPRRVSLYVAPRRPRTSPPPSSQRTTHSPRRSCSTSQLVAVPHPALLSTQRSEPERLHGLVGPGYTIPHPSREGSRACSPPRMPDPGHLVYRRGAEFGIRIGSLRRAILHRRHPSDVPWLRTMPRCRCCRRWLGKAQFRNAHPAPPVVPPSHSCPTSLGGPYGPSPPLPTFRDARIGLASQARGGGKRQIQYLNPKGLRAGFALAYAYWATPALPTMP